MKRGENAGRSLRAHGGRPADAVAGDDYVGTAFCRQPGAFARSEVEAERPSRRGLRPGAVEPARAGRGDGRSEITANTNSPVVTSMGRQVNRPMLLSTHLPLARIVHEPRCGGRASGYRQLYEIDPGQVTLLPAAPRTWCFGGVRGLVIAARLLSLPARRIDRHGAAFGRRGRIAADKDLRNLTAWLFPANWLLRGRVAPRFRSASGRSRRVVAVGQGGWRGVAARLRSGRYGLSPAHAEREWRSVAAVIVRRLRHATPHGIVVRSAAGIAHGRSRAGRAGGSVPFRTAGRPFLALSAARLLPERCNSPTGPLSGRPVRIEGGLPPPLVSWPMPTGWPDP